LKAQIAKGIIKLHSKNRSNKGKVHNLQVILVLIPSLHFAPQGK